MVYASPRRALPARRGANVDVNFQTWSHGEKAQAIVLVLCFFAAQQISNSKAAGRWVENVITFAYPYQEQFELLVAITLAAAITPHCTTGRVMRGNSR
jgi:hypothetical protein